MLCGAMAVQRTSYCTVKNQSNPIASNKQLSYNHTHNGWMLLVDGIIFLPHNPFLPELKFYLPHLKSHLFLQHFDFQFLSNIFSFIFSITDLVFFSFKCAYLFTIARFCAEGFSYLS